MHCSRVDAFRHRAAAIMRDRPARGHLLRRLTLTSRHGAIRFCVRSGPKYQAESAGRATNVIRHGLCPMLKCAREAVNPWSASLAIMSVSL